MYTTTPLDKKLTEVIEKENEDIALDMLHKIRIRKQNEFDNGYFEYYPDWCNNLSKACGYKMKFLALELLKFEDEYRGEDIDDCYEFFDNICHALRSACEYEMKNVVLWIIKFIIRIHTYGNKRTLQYIYKIKDSIKKELFSKIK